MMLFSLYWRPMSLTAHFGSCLGTCGTWLCHPAHRPRPSDIPHVILCVMPKLQQLDPNIYEAAQDLERSRFLAFRR